MTTLSGDHEESPEQTPFLKLLLWGTVAAFVGNLTGWFLSGYLLATLMSHDFMEGYGIIAALLCWVVGLPGTIAFGFLAAWLGLVIVSSLIPNREKEAAALLGFSLGVAVWVIIGTLAVILERITA